MESLQYRRQCGTSQYRCRKGNLRCIGQNHAGPNGGSHHELIRFVADRPGHDYRYAIDFAKLKAEFDWTPKNSFESGLLSTVKWYIENRAWWEPLLSKHDADIRRGLSKKSA